MSAEQRSGWLLAFEKERETAGSPDTLNKFLKEKAMGKAFDDIIKAKRLCLMKLVVFVLYCFGRLVPPGTGRRSERRGRESGNGGRLSRAYYREAIVARRRTALPVKAVRNLIPTSRVPKTKLWAVVFYSLTLALLFSGGDSNGGENTQAQNRSVVLPRNLLIDGEIREWESIPPTFVLNKYQPNSRDGLVWIGQTSKGLVIAGKVYGNKPRWPKAPDKMAVSDHIEVWLADRNDLELPLIGWGNQFGYETLATEKDCDKTEAETTRKSKDDAVKECRAWFAAQVNYRKTLRKLFVRQWQIAPDMAVETYSSPAFLSFDETLRKKLHLLEPSGSPAVKVRESAGREHAYTFELLIAWTAFPPLKPLRLSDTRIMVDVFSPGVGERKYGDFSSTAPHRKYGRPDTFNTLKLEPVEYYLTPCKYDVPASEAVIALPPQSRYLHASESASLYFIPTEERDLRTLLLLDNE